MTDPAAPQSTEPSDAAPEPVTCRAFDPRVMDRQLQVDALIRGALVAAVLVVIVGVSMWQAVSESASGLSGLLVVLVIALWMLTSYRSARAWQQLRRLTPLLDQNPVAAESLLAQTIGKWPLHRPVRLMLYHRLAVLRHRQHGYAETAAICQCVLSYRLGSAGRVRPHLLLMLAESHLYCRDLWGAWSALSGLHHCKLSVAESLQRTALQTRYEVEAGYDATAMQQLHQKVAMAELMPAPQCAAVHAMLATAAQRSEQTHVADWLRQRAQLLADPEQLSRLWPQYETGGEKLDFDESGA